MEMTIKEKYKSKRPPERARKPDETDEEYARYVMGWMAENREFIVKSVKKNITNDEELLDETFQSTTILIYENLIKHPKALDSVCDWVFLCIKSNFITAQKKKRQEIANKVQGFNFTDIEDRTEWKEREDYLTATNDFISYMCEELSEEFGDVVAQTWIIYYRLKSEKPSAISYSKLAKILQVSPNVVSQRIQQCKAFFKENEDIIRHKYKKFIRQ